MRASSTITALAIVGVMAGAATASRADTAAETPPAAADPRAGDPAFERSKRLFGVLKDVLDEAARSRLEQQTDPDGAVTGFVWRQLGVDDGARIRELLGAAFSMMADAPVVEMQERIRAARGEIDRLAAGVAELKEQRIAAPEDAGWSAWMGLADDRDSLTRAIAEAEERIAGQEAAIAETKKAFADAMAAAGAPLPPEQVDLLLESVTGGDLVEMAAAYEAVRGVSKHLRTLMDQNGEDLGFARRYYGMHTALIAMLVDAQTRFIDRIDGQYLPKLDAIEADIAAAARETERLLRDDPTPEQRRALEANARSQSLAMDALRFYRDYLKRQRAQIGEARVRTIKELRVADNTLRTVDASYQLREVMESAASNFEALEALESPGFEHLFENEQLRREFKALTERLGPGT